MKHIVFTTVCFFALCGCNANSKSPDQIRQDAADATSAASRGAAVAAEDAKAAVQGVKDGLKDLNTVDINNASEADIASLPGMNDDYAGKVIAGRPYKSIGELTSRHIVSRPEYDRISGRISAR